MQWHTQVRRYESKTEATAARFDEPEPAATKPEAKSKTTLRIISSDVEKDLPLGEITST
jgi:hypothetical protein